MLEQNELQAIAQLLQRVDLKGSEAITVANLQVKISQLLQLKEAVTNNASKPDENKTEKV